VFFFSLSFICHLRFIFRKAFFCFASAMIKTHPLLICVFVHLGSGVMKGVVYLFGLISNINSVQQWLSEITYCAFNCSYAYRSNLNHYWTFLFFNHYLFPVWFSVTNGQNNWVQKRKKKASVMLMWSCSTFTYIRNVERQLWRYGTWYRDSTAMQMIHGHEELMSTLAGQRWLTELRAMVMYTDVSLLMT